jgi:hypothetical protein
MIVTGFGVGCVSATARPPRRRPERDEKTSKFQKSNVHELQTNFRNARSPSSNFHRPREWRRRRDDRIAICCEKKRMDETKTPTRDEIPETDKWDLSHLFHSAAKWSEDFAWIQTTYPRLANWKGRVGESAPTLAELLEFDKALDLKIERVSHYASLQLAEDSANPDYLARMGQLQNLFTKIGETASFIVPEIQAIDDESVRSFSRRSGVEGMADAPAEDPPA